MRLIARNSSTSSRHSSLPFPTHATLSRWYGFGLNENLDAVAGTGKLQDVVFQLLTWAEAQGRVEELVEKARETNPGNTGPQSLCWQDSLLGQAFRTID